jgi:uracil-DNA glycosylase
MKTWKEILKPVLDSPQMGEFRIWLKKEREAKTIYPEPADTLRAFDLCPYRNVRVVIFGNEPYQDGMADGLAWSSRDQRPVELTNIFKEAYRDMNIQYFHNVTLDEFFPYNSLEKWAKGGILLLNLVLTSEQGKTMAHMGKGWERIADTVIKALNEHENRLVFLLWGDLASDLEGKIDQDRHMILKAPYPASEDFMGCRHFSIIRDVLPTIHAPKAPTGLTLNGCFDHDKAVEIVRREYPADAERLEKYIRKEMIIHVQINRAQYFQELKNFELLISTKNTN